MWFFKRREKEKTFEKKFDDLNHEVLTERDKKNPKKVEQYVIEHLKQMVEVTKEIEEEKAEYRMITSYLNDIHTIEELPEEEHGKIVDIAQNVVGLNKARYEFLHAEKKISDVQYIQMQQEEAEIPNAIRRLKENEKYLAKIKQDLKYLQREKEEWFFYKDDLRREQKSLQNVMYAVTGFLISIAVLFVILQIVLELPMKLAWTILLFAAVMIICILYLKILNARSEYKRAEINANRAIVLENKVKIKYVNIQNAVDYACEKYHVTSATDLNKTWEAYMEAIKQREKFEKNSDDLEYYTTRLIRELSKYRLYDAKVWVPQAQAIVDHKEMVEITHSLITRRQKLRKRMEHSISTVKTQREEVEKLMQNVKQMKPQMQEIIDSIDQISGAI